MLIEQLAKIKSCILLTGETGVGKSQTAFKIHQASERKNKPFIEVNIASLPQQLFQSELYGHQRGSFTGAITNGVGFCEEVKGGTLFLDEIGDLLLEDQVKILQLIEKKEFYSVGSRQKKVLDGVIILATNKNLLDMVNKKLFREDLYYRINTFCMELPPLRLNNNLRNIIKNTFLEKSQKYFSKAEMPECVMSCLLKYSWPGNYRELDATMEYIYALTPGQDININSVPPYITNNSLELKETVYDEFYSAIENFEKSFLECKLKKNKGRINKTSELIGLNKVTLISKIKKYNINTKKYQLNLASV